MKKLFIRFFAVIFLFSISQISLAQLPVSFGKLNLKDAIASLPKMNEKPFKSISLLDNGETGVRVFRVYNPVPKHHHAYSSTYLTIYSGRARFRIDSGKLIEAAAGDMVFWERGIDHEVVEIIEHPLIFIAIDAPVRRDDDVQK